MPTADVGDAFAFARAEATRRRAAAVFFTILPRTPLILAGDADLRPRRGDRFGDEARGDRFEDRRPLRRTDDRFGLARLRAARRARTERATARLTDFIATEDDDGIIDKRYFR
jgi:hypothetical protein